MINLWKGVLNNLGRWVGGGNYRSGRNSRELVKKQRETANNTLQKRNAKMSEGGGGKQK